MIRWTLAFFLLTAPAHAHKVIASVFVEGDVIEGEIAFSNGDMAAGVTVIVTTSDGEPLGEVRTDGDGFFTFLPTRAVAHSFFADLGAGHIARITLPVSELPRGLRPSAAEASPATAHSLAVNEEIAQLIRDEIRPLQREIAAYKHKNDIQTILGGIGYIIGLFGLYFFLAARNRSDGV